MMNLHHFRVLSEEINIGAHVITNPLTITQNPEDNSCCKKAMEPIQGCQNVVSTPPGFDGSSTFFKSRLVI
jgi:hypothetical protein